LQIERSVKNRWGKFPERNFPHVFFRSLENRKSFLERS